MARVTGFGFSVQTAVFARSGRTYPHLARFGWWSELITADADSLTAAQLDGAAEKCKAPFEPRTGLTTKLGFLLRPTTGAPRFLCSAGVRGNRN